MAPAFVYALQSKTFPVKGMLLLPTLTHDKLQQYNG